MIVKEIITELFQNPKSEWKLDFAGSQEFAASFQVGEIQYRFYAYTEQYPNMWEVEFSEKHDENVKGFNNLYGVTGTGNSATVMSTVVNIMKTFLQRYGDNINAISFSAEEESRQSLYARILKRMLPTWNIVGSVVDGTFLIARNEKLSK